MKNIIILGPGRTGSSFLAGLISRNKFYINRSSIQSRRAYPDGDYENPDLISLNKNIFLGSGYGYPKDKFHKPVDVNAIKLLIKTSNIEKYNRFVTKCEKNKPFF